jgi:hypothetical protein
MEIDGRRYIGVSKNGLNGYRSITTYGNKKFYNGTFISAIKAEAAHLRKLELLRFNYPIKDKRYTAKYPFIRTRQLKGKTYYWVVIKHLYYGSYKTLQETIEVRDKQLLKIKEGKT